MGEVLGYFDILPLKASFFDAFIAGKVEEKQISHENILASKSARRCRRLYLAGIAAKDTEIFWRRHVSILVWGILKFVDHFYLRDRPIELYALAATPPGEHILQKFNFELASRASERKDGYNLYRLVVSKDGLEKVIRSTRNWDGSCELGWSPKHPVTPARARLTSKSRIGAGPSASLSSKP